MVVRPVFIASMGNPGARYADTLHSAGHTLLEALVAHAGAPPLARSTRFGGGDMTETDAAAFWRSPSYMNESGRPLVSAYLKWAKERTHEDQPRPRLVILHDDLETTTGKFKMREDGRGRSHRGHNGLRSFLKVPGMSNMEHTRVGVGIGPRPQSREPDVVAEFVLRKMTEEQREKIVDLARPLWRRLV